MTQRLSERTRAHTAAFVQRKDAEAVRLTLPTPTSVNDLHAPRAGGGIRLSDAYTAWLNAAGWAINRQRPGRIAGRYALTLFLPRSSGLDLDNAIKATSDLLQDHGVIRNDREAEAIDLRWHDASDAMIVEVRPAALRGVAA